MEPARWGAERTGPSCRAASLGRISVLLLRACAADRYQRTSDTTFYRGGAGALGAIRLDPDRWREQTS